MLFRSLSPRAHRLTGEAAASADRLGQPCAKLVELMLLRRQLPPATRFREDCDAGFLPAANLPRPPFPAPSGVPAAGTGGNLFQKEQGNTRAGNRRCRVRAPQRTDPIRPSHTAPLDSPNRSALIPAVPTAYKSKYQKERRHGDINASVPKRDNRPAAARFGSDPARHGNPPTHPAR